MTAEMNGHDVAPTTPDIPAIAPGELAVASVSAVPEQPVTIPKRLAALAGRLIDSLLGPAPEQSSHGVWFKDDAAVQASRDDPGSMRHLRNWDV